MVKDMTEAERERLIILAEEASEIAASVGKALRHGYFSRNPLKPEEGDNKTKLEYEIEDFLCVMLEMIERGDIFVDLYDRSLYRTLWQNKLRWTHHQKGCEYGRF